MVDNILTGDTFIDETINICQHICRPPSTDNQLSPDIAFKPSTTQEMPCTVKQPPSLEYAMTDTIPPFQEGHEVAEM